MYNFRILIQEVQLLRKSFRIYVLIARGSACLGDIYQDPPVGAEHRGHHLGHSRPRPVLIISLGWGGRFITG